MANNPKQVQLRGGSESEHNTFVGASREVTVDTTNNTLRVHDGVTVGGHILSKKEDVDIQIEQVNENINNMMSNIGSSHNHDSKYSQLGHTHDGRYSQLGHTHDGRYYKIMSGGVHNLCQKYVGEYLGLCTEDGHDDGWVRTTTSGLIPYQAGGYSSIGSGHWKFAHGYFVNLHSDNATIPNLYSNYVTAHNQISLPGGDYRDQIKFGNDDYISYNDGTNEFDFKADNNVTKSRIRCGHIEMGGYRLYIGSSFPSDARVNDILIQI